MTININKAGNTYQIQEIYYKLKNGISVSINYIYNGSKLVWTSIRDALSAFGAGFWQNDKPWSNEDMWKNN